VNKGKILCGVIIIVFFLSGPAGAQEPERGLKIVPDTGPQRPEFLPLPPRPPKEMILPSIPPPPKEEPEIGDIKKIFVKKIILKGNTVFPPEVLDRLIEPYENRTVTNLELHKLRQKLSLYYYEQGYINSGVIIPDQKVVDGIITLQVIEGRLTEVHLSGEHRLKTEYITKRITRAVGDVLNVNTLQEVLNALEQDSRIKTIHADLEPGLRRGESILNVHIEEARPYHLYIGTDNNRSPSVGGEQAYVTAIHENLFGLGDTLSFQYSLAEGLDDYGVSYMIPLNVDGTTLQAYYRQSDSDVVEEPFDILDIENRSENGGVSLRHSFIASGGRSLTGALGLEIKESKSYLLGEPFSFSPGVEDGKSNVSVVRLGLDWVQRSGSDALILGAAARIGIDAFGATINENAPDSKFLTLQGRFQYATKIGSSANQVVLRAFTQIADDELLPIEKLAIGGIDSVRGYRVNQYVRDNGVVASLEFRLPLFPARQNKWPYRIQAVPFIDYGRSWDKDDNLPTSDAENITGIGIGLVWDLVPAFHAALYYGYALDDVFTSDNDLQDDGIHFRVSYKVF
jgi:hemolysin activation/secretion protein